MFSILFKQQSIEQFHSFRFPVLLPSAFPLSRYFPINSGEFLLIFVNILQEKLANDCLLPKKSEFNISRDPHVHILPRTYTNRMTTLIIALFIIILLMTPVAICTVVRSLYTRLGVVVVAAGIFVMILGCFTNAKLVNLAVAGAT